LATVDGVVNPGGIDFNAAPAVMDLVPNGANFEMFLTTADSKPYQLRYGKVVRREAQFTTQVVAGVSEALKFIDSWPTTGLRTSWLRAFGTTVVHDNSGISLPNGIGSQNGGGFFGEDQNNAIRWYRELGGDSGLVKVTLLNQSAPVDDFFGGSSINRLRILLCADTYLSSGVGVEFADTQVDQGPHNQTFAFVLATSPTTVAYQGTPTAHAVNDGDQYTVAYDNTAKKVTLYGADGTTVLGSWTDTGGVVPHGPGYRYLALSWFTSANSDGLQVTNWQAMDAL
jgi:hypothetical protein